MAISLGLPSTRLVASTLLLLGGSLLMGAAAFAPGQNPPAATTPATAEHPEFPPGKGRDITLTKCSGCHSANNILAQGRTREGWEDIITKMVGFGATGTDEEFTSIADYLTKNFPPAAATRVNVNTAPAADIATVLALSPADAQKIVDYRKSSAPFKTLDDLKKVPGIDPTKLDAKQDAILY